MVEWGMTPLQAIQAATINAADLFGMNEIGQIKEGFIADIIGVRVNPLENIRSLESVSFVMKEGRIVLQ
jgi:imidazolonepropionase-like amidohydrolase